MTPKRSTRSELTPKLLLEAEADRLLLVKSVLKVCSDSFWHMNQPAWVYAYECDHCVSPPAFVAFHWQHFCLRRAGIVLSSIPI